MMITSSISQKYKTVQHMQINKCETSYKQKQNKNNMISKDAEKAIYKIQNPTFTHNKYPESLIIGI